MTEILSHAVPNQAAGRAVDVVPAVNPAAAPYIEVAGAGCVFRISGPRFAGLSADQQDYVAEGVQETLDRVEGEFAQRLASHPGDPNHTPRTASETGPERPLGVSS